ncbi:hypothetical protein VNO77_43809 [Canavalia gladiata]|uniref:Uncharacterized protein n=1 Tax=Canavalia gladiata TaxID=3824 RepID=A0AAN9PQ72_CANGL
MGTCYALPKSRDLMLVTCLCVWALSDTNSEIVIQTRAALGLSDVISINEGSSKLLCGGFGSNGNECSGCSGLYHQSVKTRRPIHSWEFLFINAYDRVAAFD